MGGGLVDSSFEEGGCSNFQHFPQRVRTGE